jgi:hypothetical protein
LNRIAWQRTAWLVSNTGRLKVRLDLLCCDVRVVSLRNATYVLHIKASSLSLLHKI